MILMRQADVREQKEQVEERCDLNFRECPRQNVSDSSADSSGGAPNTTGAVPEADRADSPPGPHCLGCNPVLEEGEEAGSSLCFFQRKAWHPAPFHLKENKCDVALK